MEWLDDVRAVFEEFGIPEYIWKPIARRESGLNPLARGLGLPGRPEDSRGLFQINTRAHPEMLRHDLFDPVVNARLAAEGWILPQWRRTLALGITDPEDQAERVWRFGIRPNWEHVVRQGAHLRLRADAREIYELLGQPAPTPTPVRQTGLPVPARQAGREPAANHLALPTFLTGGLFGGGLVDDAKGVIWLTLGYIFLFILILFSLYMVFRPEIQKILPVALNPTEMLKKGSE